MYNSEGNLTEDKYLQGEGCKNARVHFYCRTAAYCALRKSKRLKISYDWRGMPVEFRLEPTGSSSDTARLSMMYDGTGRRISKTRARKEFGGDWETELVTHYTGIGTEVRENPVNGETKVVVNLPNGLGRYMPEDASAGDFGFGAGYMPPEKFEWYLKNHLGSTMLVYGTQGYSWTDAADVGSPIAAYDYRAFGEQVSLAEPSDKVTENFTGKERDDETELDYFGARYLDPMLGMWTSVDPKRQFASPYLYAGNGVNPVNAVDPDGNAAVIYKNGNNVNVILPVIFGGNAATPENIARVQQRVSSRYSGQFGKYSVSTTVVSLPQGANGGDPSGVNQVNLLNENSSICDRGSCAHIGREGLADININGKYGDFHIEHEFGHLMGLEDKYDPDTGLPYEGYSDNIMGVTGQSGIKPGQIEELWIPNSKNGSDGNFIYERE